MSYKVIELEKAIQYEDLENGKKFQYDLQTKFEKQVSYWIDKGYIPVAEVKKEVTTAYVWSYQGKQAYGTNVKWIQAVYKPTIYKPIEDD